MNEPVSIVDLISMGRHAAMTKLAAVQVPLTLPTDVGFPLTVSAMQGLPEEWMDELALPIFLRFFEDYGLDPAYTSDLDQVRQYDEVIAGGIRAAANAVMQNIQQQQQSRERLLSGTLARG
jgi:hypothetical protein